MVRHLVDDILNLPDSEQVDVIVAIINSLQTHSLAGLIRRIEAHFGVKASSPIRTQNFIGHIRMPGDALVEEKTEFTVFLMAIDAAKKIQAIKEIRAITGLGLKEAKDLVEAAPKPIKEKLSKADAETAKRLLEAAGATIELR